MANLTAGTEVINSNHSQFIEWPFRYHFKSFAGSRIDKVFMCISLKLITFNCGFADFNCSTQLGKFSEKKNNNIFKTYNLLKV